MHRLGTCPCCGYRTIGAEFEICDICAWEHDLSQEAEPYENGVGANDVSLKEGQENFAAFGACTREELAIARRPGPEDERDPDWKPLP
jgi:hypothetical protein